MNCYMANFLFMVIVNLVLNDFLMESIQAFTCDSKIK